MATGRYGEEYRQALERFCGELQKLRADAGLSVDALLAARVTPPLGLRRSQVYALLAGDVVEPPAWDFVRGFVAECAARGRTAGRAVSVSTDLQYWRREHDRLTERFEDRAGRAAGPQRPPAVGRDPEVLTLQEKFLQVVPAASVRRVGVVTGDVRQVRDADIWVNSENTDMAMARVQESSTSAIIRYEGARRDVAGRVIDDVIARELEAQVAGVCPVGPGEVFVTGPGELRPHNGVRYVIHAAAVHGQPGAGFRPVAQIGRCVENALAAAERLEVDVPTEWTILFPLFGAGTGGGDPFATARTLLHTAYNYLRAVPTTRIGTALFLAYTDVEREACLRALHEVREISRVTPADDGVTRR